MSQERLTYIPETSPEGLNGVVDEAAANLLKAQSIEEAKLADRGTARATVEKTLTRILSIERLEKRVVATAATLDQVLPLPGEDNWHAEIAKRAETLQEEQEHPAQ